MKKEKRKKKIARPKEKKHLRTSPKDQIAYTLTDLKHERTNTKFNRIVPTQQNTLL